MPTSVLPGTWAIGDWAQAVVTINKLPISKVTKIETSREMNVASGTCTVEVSDPDHANYDVFQANDEIEIYMSTITAPVTGIKIWGGYMDNPSFDINKGQTFNITGKEYMTRLQGRTYTGSFVATDIADALRTIMASQTDFTFEGIPAALVFQTTSNFTNESMFDSMKAICDPYRAYFWIDPTTRDFAARVPSDIVFTPDSVTQGVNLLRQSKVQRNTEYLTNKLNVNYGGATPGTVTVEDLASQASFGIYERTITVGSITSSGAATSLGNNIIANKKDPIEIYELTSNFLPYTDPGEYINVSAPSLNLNDKFQVLRIKHTWNPSNGIQSSVMINTQKFDARLYISDLEKRLKLVEQTTFS